MIAARQLIFLVVLLPALLANVLSVRAADCCNRCNCRKVKKVTRLVQTLKEIKVPAYACALEQTFHPEKGAVCHTGYRCDTYYTPHVHWCGEERCVTGEHCEHVEHCVDKGQGNCECECSEERHHKRFQVCDVKWSRHGCVTCETVSGCQTLYGASPAGCFKDACVKQPTGKMCTRLVPELRWVTQLVCPECHHAQPCDADTARLSREQVDVPQDTRPQSTTAAFFQVAHLRETLGVETK